MPPPTRFPREMGGRGAEPPPLVTDELKGKTVLGTLQADVSFAASAAKGDTVLETIQAGVPFTDGEPGSQSSGLSSLNECTPFCQSHSQR